MARDSALKPQPRLRGGSGRPVLDFRSWGDLQDDDKEHLMTTAQVLDYLHVSLRTIYRLIKAEQLPAFRVGRQWRFRRSEIESYLESSRGRR